MADGGAHGDLVPLRGLMFFHSHLEGLVTNIRVHLGRQLGEVELFIAQRGESGTAPLGTSQALNLRNDGT